MKKNDIIFSIEQLSLLKEFYRLHLSIRQFSREKGLAVSTFFRLLRIFESSNPEIADRMKQENSPKPEAAAEITALRLENERLRAELKHEKMRSHAYDTMIDVAEEMFNIPIRKKADTKR